MLYHPIGMGRLYGDGVGAKATVENGELSAALAKAAVICRARGGRFTAQRQLVYRLILGAEKPSGAYELLEAMRAEVPGVAPPTVYRALEFLLEQGLIHKLESLHAYVGCRVPERNHEGQFLICNRCGRTEEMYDYRVSKSLSAAMANHGFKGVHQMVEVTGRCSDCSVK